MANAAREAAERQADVSRRTSSRLGSEDRNAEPPSRPRRNSIASVQTSTSSSSFTARNPSNRRPPPWWSSPRLAATSLADRSSKFASGHVECRSRPFSPSVFANPNGTSGPDPGQSQSQAVPGAVPLTSLQEGVQYVNPLTGTAQTGLSVGAQDQNQTLQVGQDQTGTSSPQLNLLDFADGVSWSGTQVDCRFRIYSWKQ